MKGGTSSTNTTLALALVPTFTTKKLYKPLHGSIFDCFQNSFREEGSIYRYITSYSLIYTLHAFPSAPFSSSTSRPPSIQLFSPLNTLLIMKLSILVCLAAAVVASADAWQPRPGRGAYKRDAAADPWQPRPGRGAYKRDAVAEAEPFHVR